MPASAPSDFSWTDLVRAPLLILDAAKSQVLRLNDALRHVLPLTCPPTPAPMTEILGAEATVTLLGYLLTMPEDGSRNTLSLTCPTMNGPMMLILHLARLPDHADQWVVTVDERTLFFQGGASENAENTFRGIIQELPIGIDILDSSLRAVFYNHYSDSIYLYDSYYDLDLTEWFERAFPAPADRERARMEWADALVALQQNPDQPQTMEWRVMCRDGQYRVLLNRVSKIGSHYTFIYWDITEQRRLEDQLRTLATTDMLTGLHNRRHFFETAEELLAEALTTEKPFCLLILDIDHFKLINDTRGHRAGDEALVAVAARCRAAIRAGDLLARFGGEEFTVLLHDTPMPQAKLVAERLRALIAEGPIHQGQETFSVTASIGLAMAEAGMTSMDQLVEKADKALYAAKHAGRNRVMIASAA
ncbi:GGDEF domain-containing protein [Acidisoma cellulosilytica]|uniref:diguanylate cyclase n=1 Tax=Acidisoma cellulosilyticum TaxID=2802395 RepID=A0A963YZN0_9PROT|nr:sensor domain-containing diguanylate cyclase [Acidisoma cellulosilyticum]MCB8879819.1 GGDEF domain-containing protein [Acidisoma cellulosilyticum]